MNPKEFATFYIAGELPWSTIDLDGDSPTDIPAPFKKLVLKPEYLGGRELRLRDEIHRHDKVKKAFQQQASSATGTDTDKDLNELYRKARVWCETNQRLVEQQKYPQATVESSGILASKFSDLHQEAVQGAREQLKVDEAAKEEAERADKGEEKQANSGLVAGGRETLESELDRKLHEIFGEMTRLRPPAQFKKKEEKTQYDLIVKDPSVIDAKARHRPPKPFWKKNKYPLQSKREVIAERRKLARPLTAEELELDYLPGIWEPQLMVNEFALTNIAHDYDDSRKAKDEEKDENYEPITWYERQERNEKCTEWLNSIQE